MFDVVFFGMPYVYVDAIDKFVDRYGELAYSMFDEGYAAQRMFLRRALSVTSACGEVLVGFSNVGDQDRFDKNLDEFTLDAELLAVEAEGKADNRLYCLRSR